VVMCAFFELLIISFFQFVEEATDDIMILRNFCCFHRVCAT
jgi:hypothetical protein